ncbi:MAG: DUF3857 domain-containing protein [candidate division Zixibacteria bacterium]|nr:DUF3857 domain-containing protein [candidate division Zixibacteria bacterium]
MSFVLRYFTISLLTIIVLSGLVQSQKFGKISEEDWNTQPPEQFPEAKAVIIFDHAEMLITAYPFRVKIERHVRIKVFNKNGADDALNIAIPYFQDDNVKAIKAHTINLNGKKTSVKKHYTISAETFKQRIFTFPAVEDGAILEYKYIHAHKRFTFLDPWYFQNKLYTLESRFSVIPYPGFTYSISSHNVPVKNRKAVVEEVRLMKVQAKKFTWMMNDIVARKNEPLSGAIEDYKPSLHFQLRTYRDGYNDLTYYKHWGYIGGGIMSWRDDLIEECEDIVQSLSDSLCSQLENQDDRIKSCYSYVRDEIETRYDTDNKNFKYLLKKKAAGPSEKNILLSILLQKQGIEAYPMMIGTRDLHEALTPENSQLNMINHTICIISHGRYIDRYATGLDTRDKNAIYPYLSSEVLVENGIVIEKDSVWMIPLRHPERDNGIDVMTTLVINTDRSAVCSTTISIKGYSMSDFRDIVSDSVSSDKWLKRLYGNIEIDHSVQDIVVSYDAEQDKITCNLAILLPDYCDTIDKNQIFAPFVLSMFENPFISSTRVFPIDFRYTSHHRNFLRIILPEEQIVHQLPDNIDHKSKGLDYSRDCRAQNNLITIKEYFSIHKTFYPREDYEAIKSTFDAIEALQEDQILFTGSTP